MINVLLAEFGDGKNRIAHPFEAGNPLSPIPLSGDVVNRSDYFIYTDYIPILAIVLSLKRQIFIVCAIARTMNETTKQAALHNFIGGILSLFLLCVFVFLCFCVQRCCHFPLLLCNA